MANPSPTELDPRVTTRQASPTPVEAPSVKPQPAVSSPRRKNSFDIARFVAASLVLVSHSFALTGNVEPKVGDITLGLFSVWVFFIMSGFLITQSWIQYPRFMVFMIKRALRIFPALIVVCVASIIVLGFFSTLSYYGYLKTPGAVQYLNNILMFNTSYGLPGVFSTNVYPGAVNGSLWTLAYEFTMYLSIAFLGALFLFRRWSAFGIWLGLLLLNVVQLFDPFKRFFTFNLFYLDARLMSQLALMFYTGVVLQVFVKRIQYKAILWVPALGLFFLATHYYPSSAPVLSGLLLGYGVLGFCHLRTFSGFGRYGDFSYGIYVYAFVVQQVVADVTGTRSALEMFVLAFPATVILGALSWRLIEARCLKLKKAVQNSDYPLTERHMARVRSFQT